MPPAEWNALAATALAAVQSVDAGRRVLVGPAAANTRAAAWAAGRELLVGEFGAIGLADRASRLYWIGWVRREPERLGLGWCLWALGTEFRLWRPDRGWDRELLAALHTP